jgi:CTP:molybdopterin cytidylyltransferase MocA
LTEVQDVVAILLAGGESSRMGSPKPLLDWGGTTLVEYQVRQLREAGCGKIIVVLGHRADEVRPAVHRAGAQAILNELYAEGRASSVRVAAGALPEDTGAIVVLNADQPRPAWVTRRLLEEHQRTGASITVPAFQGRRGHPAVFAGRLAPELREVREATEGMRGVMRAHETAINEVPLDTPVVVLDMNVPEEYEEAKATYFEQVKQ